MYGEQHLLAYRSQEESRIVYGLSFRQLGWWACGAVISMKLCSWLPRIPFIGYWGYLPYLIPFAVGVIFAHVRHPSTNQHLSAYLSGWVKCRRRKRKFT